MGIRITAAQFGPTVARKLAEIRQGALRVAYDAAKFGEAKAIKNTSAAKKVDRGLFKNSWDSKPLENGAEIRNDCPYAASIEIGSRPHWPPFKPIFDWVYRKRGEFGIRTENDARRIARAVQRKIVRSGTKPNFIMKNVLPEIVREMKAQIDREVGAIAKRG